ncbi:hypothetical protein, partial [Ignatzschineria indica]|uniref:hypothetical protein n=1 Tax=Ignatzschineria indica TaxID=472583 RepID=UPI003645629F
YKNNVALACAYTLAEVMNVQQPLDYIKYVFILLIIFILASIHLQLVLVYLTYKYYNYNHDVCFNFFLGDYVYGRSR